MKKLLLVLLLCVGSIVANADIVWDKNTTLGEIVNLSNGTELLKDEKVMGAIAEMLARGYSRGYSEQFINNDLRLKFARVGEDAMIYLMSNIDGSINLSNKIVELSNATYRD